MFFLIVEESSTNEKNEKIFGEGVITKNSPSCFSFFPTGGCVLFNQKREFNFNSIRNMKSRVQGAVATAISGVSNAVCTASQLVIESSIYLEKKSVSKLTGKSEQEIVHNRVVNTFENVSKVKEAINNLEDRIRNRKVDYKRLGLA